jgi:hypothetical protein
VTVPQGLRHLHAISALLARTLPALTPFQPLNPLIRNFRAGKCKTGKFKDRNDGTPVIAKVLQNAFLILYMGWQQALAWLAGNACDKIDVQ